MNTPSSSSATGAHGAKTADAGGLVEVWGDTVSLVHLGWSIIMGAAISLSGYFIVILLGVPPTPFF